jgi:hypothetical protein
MGTLSRSAVALVALVAAVALVGGVAGCVDDGEYDSSGDSPPLAPPPGASPDCDIGVAPPAAAGAVDSRAPHAPSSARSTRPARTLRELSAPDEIEPVGFKTAGCERNAGE